MKGVKVVNIRGKFYWYQFCRSQVLNFKCFCASRNKNRTLGCFWSFLVRTSQNVVNFVWNFDQWWHARWCIRYATAFIVALRIGRNWATKLIFWLILRFCFYALLHPMRYTPRYILVVSFFSIAYVILKLKMFKIFCIDSASIKWTLFRIFWALTPPNIVWSCWKFDQR